MFTVPRRMLLLALLLTLRALCADTVTLKDGTVVEGEIVEETDEKIVLKMKFGTVTYARKEIEKLERGAAQAPADAAGLRDVVTLKNGEKHEGLLVSESPDEVVLDLIASGRNVSKTMLLRTTFARAEIVELQKLDDAQRDAARKFLEGVKSEDRRDKAQAGQIVVEPIEWPSTRPGITIKAWRTEFTHFTLESNTEEDFHRRCALSLWKVYEAYKEHFGADRGEGERIRVVILNSMAEYYASIGNQIQNPAFYMPSRKLIWAGCDVAPYKRAIGALKDHFDRQNAELDRIRAGIQRQRMEIQQQVREAQAKLFKNGRTTPAGQRAWEQVKAQEQQVLLAIGREENKIKEVQEEIRSIGRQMDVLFRDVTKEMFQTLYHEGFHGFLDNFLFEKQLVEHVPRWLNEGLAQYFEVSRLEGGRLVLGQEDSLKLALLRRWQKDLALPAAAKIATSGAQDFLVHEITNLEHSTKHYLMSWALVHWLGENNRLTKDHLTAYVKALAEGKPPLDAMALLTGLPNDGFQAAIDKKLAYDFKAEQSGQPVPPGESGAQPLGKP